MWFWKITGTSVDAGLEGGRRGWAREFVAQEKVGTVKCGVYHRCSMIISYCKCSTTAYSSLLSSFSLWITQINQKWLRSNFLSVKLCWRRASGQKVCQSTSLILWGCICILGKKKENMKSFQNLSTCNF